MTRSIPNGEEILKEREGKNREKKERYLKIRTFPDFAISHHGLSLSTRLKRVLPWDSRDI